MHILKKECYNFFEDCFNHDELFAKNLNKNTTCLYIYIQYIFPLSDSVRGRSFKRFYERFNYVNNLLLFMINIFVICISYNISSSQFLKHQTEIMSYPIVEIDEREHVFLDNLNKPSPFTV